MPQNRESKTSPVLAPVRRKWPTLKRDSVIWLLGLGIAFNEAILQDKAQAEVLVFAAGLLGLPGILAANDFAKRLVAAAAALEKKEGQQ